MNFSELDFTEAEQKDINHLLFCYDTAQSQEELENILGEVLSQFFYDRAKCAAVLDILESEN
jgi:hypothetical protein